ncbi:hypothetical protein T459_18809 [Capsicum annuum]|uniref:Serine-threonine/tyrosine-protein kinase catalytic domain-containing protein n=1 Tax=Capsicum annuum TaxID=4072 RepID=A0A2G2YZT5_CAPAN|nr:hypothetical protein T459_18809 [Capsicum annuum]
MIVSSRSKSLARLMTLVMEGTQESRSRKSFYGRGVRVSGVDVGVCVFAVKKAIASDAPDWVVTGSFGCGNEVIMDDLRDNVRYTEGEGGEIPGSIFFDIRHFDVVVISRNGALNQSAKGSFWYFGDEGYMSTKSDVYVFGMLLVELITKKELDDSFSNSKEGGKKNVVDESFKEVDCQTGSRITSLTYRCTEWKPVERPTMKDVLDVLTEAMKMGARGEKRKRDENEAVEAAAVPLLA